MESELMPCPICGESCTSYREFAELPAKVQCDVMLCNYAPESASRAEGIEQHNTLARRAEIGALVERMMSDARSVALRFGLAVDLTDGSEYVEIILWYRAGESGRTQSCGQGATLLEALRALAKEVGCE